MVRFLNIREPGPTDLSWDEKNSADYLYRSADLSTLRASSKKGRVSGKKRNREKAKAGSKTNE